VTGRTSPIGISNDSLLLVSVRNSPALGSAEYSLHLEGSSQRILQDRMQAPMFKVFADFDKAFEASRKVL